MQLARHHSRPQWRPRRMLLLLAGIIVIAAVALPWMRTASADVTSGVVYRDYNSNGAQDAFEFGVPGVTVTAYAANNSVLDTQVTNANGQYSLTVPSSPEIRVEFSGYGTYLSGPFGGDSGTTVQFVPSNAIDVNLGINKPSEYCQSNPVLVTSCYTYAGDTGNAPGTDADIVSFPFNAGTTSVTDNANVANPTTHTIMRPESEAGAVWGVAYQRSTQSVFSAAFMKRHTRFGPGGTGAIYRTDAANPGNPATVFLDVNALFGAGTAGANAHNTGDYFNDNGNAGWDGVGKIAWGDIDMGEDDSTLWGVNLADRQLYRFPLTISGGVPVAPAAGAISRYPIPNLVPCSNAGDLRPGAVKAANDVIYVGVICTAESSQNAADLQAAVFSFDPGSTTWNLVTTFALNYPRGQGSCNGTTCIEGTWNPWSPIITDTGVHPWAPQSGYPQPWITGIEFDETGAMIVALMDRYGHQTGNNHVNVGPVEGVAVGDILRLAASGSTYVLESNGSSGGITTPGNNNTEGPGGGEFFFQDRYVLNTFPTHDETTLGSLAVVLGTNQVVSSAYDPAPVDGPAGSEPFAYRSGGFIWHRIKEVSVTEPAGGRARSYMLFEFDEPLTFGKASGVGDIEALCQPAPLEIGNRVWFDWDGDGIQDPEEVPIAGIVLELYENGVLVGTATTDANGNYIFNDSNVPGGIKPNTNYEIRIQLGQSGMPANLVPTLGNSTGDLIDSDGINQGAFVSTSFTTGGPGDNNHSYDFGFTAAPTAVQLFGFIATPNAPSQAIDVSWRTGIEENTVGFLIFRSTSEERTTAQQVTPNALPTRGDNSSYGWRDQAVDRGQDYYYWLRSIDANGEVTEYGPTSAQLPLATNRSTIFLPFMRQH